MTRPQPPDAKLTGGSEEKRHPWEYESELAKYKAISDFQKACGQLSDVTDTFHHYEARGVAMTRRGLARPYRAAMYKHYKKNSLNHLRMAVNELVRLLTQPKIIVHGSDFIRDDYKEPGFFANMINGGKKLLGMKVEEPRPQTSGVQNGRY